MQAVQSPATTSSPATASIERVAIVGAGIAGLTAALCLARNGIASDIFEAAPRLEEVGAGLQISPNAAGMLQRLGLLPALEERWTEPERVSLVCGRTLRELAHVPAGDFARKRWRAPYGVLHRATLQQALLQAVTAEPLCRLHLNSNIGADAGTALTALTGQAYPLVIGADGVWSRLRDTIAGSGQADFSGNVAWRFTVAANDTPSWLSFDAPRVSAFVGPQTHLIAYPLKETGGINIVAIAAGLSPGRDWQFEAQDSQSRLLTRQFALWDRRIVALLENAGRANFWPLHEVTPGSWQNGSDRVLIGDAAHAMMPFAAQGACMAIEDAFLLAASLSRRSTLAAALTDFEALRKPRVARVRARGALNRFAYHARGPFRLGRDIVLSLRTPQALAADLDWLYGYRPAGDADRR